MFATASGDQSVTEFERVIIRDCAIATVDEVGTEHSLGYIVVEGGRITAVEVGAPPEFGDDVSTHVVDANGCLATPGLVNCHHHLFQWLTRGFAQQCDLFNWLVALYPTWTLIDEQMQYASTRAGIASLLTSGCSTATDHHYLFGKTGGDQLGASIRGAQDLGIRFHPCRGSMDLGESAGGLPPDSVVESRDDILSASEAAIAKYHDPSFDSMLRIAIAPCSPFSVTKELMVEAAGLARKHGLRLHTHLAETVEEDAFCAEQFGVRPVEYLEELGWLGPDVWLAHCVHLNDKEVEIFARTGTGVAHCPSSNARLGAGIARVADLIAAGAAVGLGVDGAASNESGELAVELREALLLARLRGGAEALTARQALALGTIHGARCLGREHEIGSLEVGKLADIALWRLDTLAHAGMEDPVAALVLGPPRRVDRLFVQGKEVVESGALATGDEVSIAQELGRESKRLLNMRRPEVGGPADVARRIAQDRAATPVHAGAPGKED